MMPEDEDLTLEFRDGRRLVPPHLYPELAQIDTHTMTYEQAVRLADERRQNRWLGDVQHGIVSRHFGGRGL